MESRSRSVSKTFPLCLTEDKSALLPLYVSEDCVTDFSSGLGELFRIFNVPPALLEAAFSVFVVCFSVVSLLSAEDGRDGIIGVVSVASSVQSA